MAPPQDEAGEATVAWAVGTNPSTAYGDYPILTIAAAEVALGGAGGGQNQHFCWHTYVGPGSVTGWWLCRWCFPNPPGIATGALVVGSLCPLWTYAEQGSLRQTDQWRISHPVAAEELLFTPVTTPISTSVTSTAFGGDNYFAQPDGGGAGTVYLRDTDEPSGTLLIDRGHRLV